MIILALCGIAALFLYCQILSRRLSYARAYWRYELCHLLAGFFVAGGAASVIRDGWIIFGASMAFGVLWEAWEYLFAHSAFLSRSFGRIGWKHGPWALSDTVFDLLLDAAGAFVFLSLLF